MKNNILISLLCVCGLILSGCGTAQSGERTSDAIEDSASTAEDIFRDETETQNVITLDNDDISISGSGVEIADDGDIHISEGGVYRITGHSDDQHIVVKPGENESVTVILDDCSITCVDDDVLYFKNAASAEVILSAGTQNTLISSKTISEETETDEDEDASGAVIRAKCSLTLSGDGALSVEGAVNNGIAATGALVVESGTYVVSAANDALKSREDLTIDGGSISLTASGDAVQADGDIIINGGDLTLTTGTGAEGAEMKVSDSLMMGNFGGFGGGQRKRHADIPAYQLFRRRNNGRGHYHIALFRRKGIRYGIKGGAYERCTGPYKHMQASDTDHLSQHIHRQAYTPHRSPGKTGQK